MTPRILKPTRFQRWMDTTPLDNDSLRKAVWEMEQGLIDADLGGGIVKKRIAFPGRGKRGSARTIVATNKGNRWIFLFGFRKNQKDNITPAEQKMLQKLAQDYLSLSEQDLQALIDEEKFEEVCYDDPPEQNTGRSV